MFRIVFSVLVLVSFYSLVGANMTPEEIAWHGLLDMTDKSDFIAVGTVELMTSKFRENVISVGSDFIMTDVLVKIEQLIKGQPNVGKHRIKFAIHGGTAYVAKEDSVKTHTTKPNVTFEIGEKVLLFLRNTNDETYYQNFPHGRHRVHMWEFGKRLVKNDKVTFKYEKKAKTTIIPLGLATVLVRSYLKDKDSTIALEDEIKTVVRNSSDDRVVQLSSDLITRLKNGSKAIIARRK